jgi:diguanylate cyclase (GGDEF)-like protein
MPQPLISQSLPSALLRIDKLPTLPAVAIEILRLADDPNASADDLVAAMEHDPALAAKLIQLANSSMFSSGWETTVLRDAVMRLGVKTVKLMALSFSLVSHPTGAHDDERVLEGYWRWSLTLATASRALARAARVDGADEAFLCGLLANIGQLALLELAPQDYSRVLERAAGRMPSLQDEESALGLHRGHVAEALLKSWGLPLRVMRGSQWALMLAAEPQPQTPAEKQLHSALALGRLATELLVDKGGANALRALTNEAASHGLSEAALNAALLKLEYEMHELAAMFQLSLPAERDYASILDEARRQIVNVSLGSLAELRQERNRSDALASANRELATAASTDGLTGLANRATFDRFLADQLTRRANGGMQKTLGLVMVDVDHFKRFNDTHGHACGDRVLRVVAQILKRGLRSNDLAARYGGEEFAMAYPEIGPDELQAAAERLRAALAAHVLQLDGTTGQITASFGCAYVETVEPGADTGPIGAALCAAADKALYAAKRAGRNRVAMAPN